MIATSTKFTPSPDVVHTKLKNGDAVLLHLGISQYFTLNETGARIWEWMVVGLTVEEIGHRIATTYDVTPERARECVSDLVQDLSAEKLVLSGSD